MASAVNPKSSGALCYWLGFFLALALTAFAFALAGINHSLPPELLAKLSRTTPWLVEGGTKLARSWIIKGIVLLAGLQVLVHLHYFLHLDLSLSNHPKIRLIAFTLLILLFMVAGSFWIMNDLNRIMGPH